jgi:hypothetical protein
LPGTVGTCLATTPDAVALVVLSDLLDETLGPDEAVPPLSPFWRALFEARASGRAVVVVEILHADERDFPWTDNRPYEFVDPAGRGTAVRAAPASARDPYLAALARHRTRIRAVCERCAVSLVTARTDEPLVGPVAAIFAALAGHRGGPSISSGGGR